MEMRIWDRRFYQLCAATYAANGANPPAPEKVFPSLSEVEFGEEDVDPQVAFENFQTVMSQVG